MQPKSLVQLLFVSFHVTFSAHTMLPLGGGILNFLVSHMLFFDLQEVSLEA